MLGPQAGRFFESTRGKIVTLLRRSGMTADEIAQALGLTDNAVRAHLTTLERDGLVRPNGARHEGRVGKPATIYQLSPDVEPLFSKAYLPLLTFLVGALGERLREPELASLFRQAGRHLGASARPCELPDWADDRAQSRVKLDRSGRFPDRRRRPS